MNGCSLPSFIGLAGSPLSILVDPTTTLGHLPQSLKEVTGGLDAASPPLSLMMNDTEDGKMLFQLLAHKDSSLSDWSHPQPSASSLRLPSTTKRDDTGL